MTRSTSRFDLEALEFEAVRDLLARRLSTPLGRTAVADLGPGADVRSARHALDCAVQIAERLRDDDPPPLRGVVEVRSWLGGFFAGEHALDARDLADLKRMLRAARAVRAWLRRDPTRAAFLELSEAFPELDDLVEELELVVDDRGEVLSSASSKLAEVRAEIEAAEAGVRAAVAGFLSDERVRRYLQSPEPSWRHGRPVFQVRQEWRSRVPGVLHDRSQSGATVFVEPSAVVEAANRLSDARAAEHREVQVLLAQVARGLRRCRSEIDATVEGLAHVDLLTACARLIAEEGFIAPAVEEKGVLRLTAARHPLLEIGMARERVVPLDVTLGDPYRLLVVTGPNTGGKTVALKTIGLLSAMALAGVPVPAGEGTRVPFFDGIFADIGDEQAIRQNLSTFSSHVKRIARCLSEATSRSLVLIDELGAGTDPEEGGALGYALLEELVRRGGLAAVTTHLGRLKDFAHRHAEAVNGSMAFDGGTLSPLFRLDVGVPGASHALDIAARVGMPEPVVARARDLIGRRDLRVEEAVQHVQKARREAERHARRSADLSRRIESEQRELERRLAEVERERAFLSEEADHVVEREFHRLRRTVGEPLRRLAREAPSPHAEAARQVLERLEEALRSTRLHRRRMKFIGGLRKDSVVYVARFRRRCVVKKIDRVRELITIEVGKMRVEVPFEDVSWLQPLDEE